VLIVFGVAMVGILVEAFAPRKHRYTLRCCWRCWAWPPPSRDRGAGRAGYGTTKAHIAAMGAVAVDGPALFLQGTILLVGIVAVFTFAERRLDPRRTAGTSTPSPPRPRRCPAARQEKAAVRAGFTSTEVFPLLMFAIGGMLVFPAANDLLTLFVALRCLAAAVHPVRAVRRNRLMSQEAAVKYFLLGAFSSAFLLFGIALLYGYAGTVSYSGISR